MLISDWSSDVCSSDLVSGPSHNPCRVALRLPDHRACPVTACHKREPSVRTALGQERGISCEFLPETSENPPYSRQEKAGCGRSEEHTSELQSLMRISYAVFCLKKQKITTYQQ